MLIYATDFWCTIFLTDSFSFSYLKKRGSSESSVNTLYNPYNPLARIVKIYNAPSGSLISKHAISLCALSLTN